MTYTAKDLDRWTRNVARFPHSLTTIVGPFRKIVKGSRALRIRRGRGWYVSEALECGHGWSTNAGGAVAQRAERRRCTDCRDVLNKLTGIR